MSLNTMPLARVEPQPWRNGGGSTRELLAWPSAEDWQLRISVAEIERDGPFSAYPGVERWCAVISGANVVLRFGEQRTMAEPGGAPLQFRGEDMPECSLVGSAAHDLNLMCRRDSGQGSMQLAVASEEWLSVAPLRALYCADALVLQIDDTDAAAVAADTLVWTDHGTRQRWRMRDACANPRAWWLAFEPKATA